jgi:hypothetical protein
MYVYKVRKRKYITGGGVVDWIANAASFISANKDTIKGVADVVSNVAKAGVSTVSAVKQIRDAVRSKKELSQDSRDTLRHLGGGFKMISN